jgi:putative salt-induced outer membrane protein
MKRLLFISTVAMGFCSLVSAEEPTKNWKNETQLTFLSARGNSQSRTVGAGEKFNWGQDKTALESWAHALNVESDNQRTSERYDAGEKAEWKLTGRNYLFERAQWESNRFAGYSHRYDASVGVGRELVKTKADDLFGEIGGGYINEQLVKAPRNDFGSGRLYAKYIREISKTSSFSQDGEYLHNFDDPNGYRVNTETALKASLSTQMALKVSYTWKHVHEPPAGFKRDDNLTLLSLLINY